MMYLKLPKLRWNMLKVKLDKKGVLFKELSNAEKIEVQNQFKTMFTVFDPNIEKYRFWKSMQYGWIITNANNLPLRTSRMRI